MNFHNLNNMKEYPFSEGMYLECGNSLETWTDCRNAIGPFLFKGFMMGFLPSNVAHLAIVKEQSRESIEDMSQSGRNAHTIKINQPVTIVNLWATVSCKDRSLFYFPNTSIKQFLKVPAMSTLTTGDLDELYDNIVRLYTNCVRLKRVVTPVVPRPGISTAGEVLSGEEARMRNV